MNITDLNFKRLIKLNYDKLFVCTSEATLCAATFRDSPSLTGPKGSHHPLFSWWVSRNWSLSSPGINTLTREVVSEASEAPRSDMFTVHWIRIKDPPCLVTWVSRLKPEQHQLKMTWVQCSRPRVQDLCSYMHVIPDAHDDFDSYWKVDTSCSLHFAPT